MKYTWIAAVIIISMVSCATKNNTLSSPPKQTEAQKTAALMDTSKIQCREIAQGSYSRVKESSVLIARTESELAGIMALCGIKDIPAIDFNTQAVVAAFAGEFSTGGYSIRLASSQYTAPDNLALTFALVSPKPTSMVTQAFTYPYTIIAVDVAKVIYVQGTIE